VLVFYAGQIRLSGVVVVKAARIPSSDSRVTEIIFIAVFLPAVLTERLNPPPGPDFAFLHPVITLMSMA